MKNKYFISLLISVLFGCADLSNKTFKSTEIVSSKGEKLFVNSVNKGITNDYQWSIISKDSLKLQQFNDTTGSIEGLEPFIYRFKNDSLTIYFYQRQKFKIKDRLQSIYVSYRIINNDEEYLNLKEKTFNNSEYFSVPSRR